MIVYGDAVRLEAAGDALGAVRRALAEPARRPPGLPRHAALVSAFVAAAELVQALADAEFEARGCDERSPDAEAGTAFLVDLARALDRSVRDGFAGCIPLPALPDLGDPNRPLRLKTAEGYAFYALYPEAYLEAARRSGLGPDTRVIGIRSIGLGLAALVAAALGAAPPVSLRPVGHPFRRELRIGPALARDLAADPARPVAVVDEGPGLSGSSVASVADWLVRNGVGRDRIHVFPSHAGLPGQAASPEIRAFWSLAPRHVVAFEDLLGPSAPGGLARWVEDLVGPLDGPLETLSGGNWRAHRYAREADWPAADPGRERLKYLARTRRGDWLVRFAGLGGEGERKLDAARLLHGAGWAPEPAGLCHGFLVERWIGAPGLDRAAFPRARLVLRLGDYIGFRARELPARRGGASLADLAAMARHNTGEALGADAARSLDRILEGAAALEPRVRRVDVDGKLDVHEWLVDGGRLVKTDGLDHSGAHDLVGCQDMAWDVAGAMAEFGLSRTDSEDLARAAGRKAGRAVDPDLVALLRPCYLAFRLGAATMAAASAGRDEAGRLRRAADRYAEAIRQVVRAS
ncbi:hypothetical protein [Prosthecomicrobium sp. N25]|uniref:hypothetical protein n=1 Tax=Prosthecomicrobium sp. N25 TaxID=3129254 RepID=UPI0030782C50